MGTNKIAIMVGAIILVVIFGRWAVVSMTDSTPKPVATQVAVGADPVPGETWVERPETADPFGMSKFATRAVVHDIKAGWIRYAIDSPGFLVPIGDYRDTIESFKRRFIRMPQEP